ncbi:MAG: hypothetical protein DMD45_05400 [Gemmatimonadetes bacterium]|nr:MAG: hypothetical protein DMD45_05400 [Gemmatimonadota bacterium]
MAARATRPIAGRGGLNAVIKLLLLAAGMGGIFLLVGALVVPEAGTLTFLWVLYMNVVAIASQVYHIPAWVGGGVIVLIAIPFGVYVFLRGHRLILDSPFAWMLAFLAASLLSTTIARDRGVAFQWLFTYVSEGLLLYLLVINTIRVLPVLRRALWVLISAGSVLACLSLFQGVTGSGSQFGGLAQRNIEGYPASGQLASGQGARVPVRLGNRAAGPIGDPNRYAQILIVLLPMALLRMRAEQRRALKLLAGLAALLILGGIALTYSRGALLALGFLALAMAALRYIRWRDLLLAPVVAIAFAVIAGPRLLQRIDTASAVPDLLQNGGSDPSEADGAIRGRLTEMLAAFAVYRDYPIIGVGPGQFAPIYSVEYMDDRDIAFRALDRTRRAHNLYLELAAETGTLGIVAFLVIVGVVCHRLWRARRFWLRTHPPSADLATSFLLCLMAYLTTALFLHLSYQRYYWLLLALAGAAVHILRPPTEQPATSGRLLPRRERQRAAQAW